MLGSHKGVFRWGFGSSLTVILGLMTGLLVTVGYVYWQSLAASYREQTEHQVEGVASLKAERLLEFRKELLSDATEYTHGIQFADVALRSLRGRDPVAMAQLTAWMQATRQNKGYDAVMLLDLDFNKRIVASDKEERPVSFVTPDVMQSLKEGNSVIEDFYFNEFNGKIFLKALAPIFHPDGRGGLIGILAIRIDPDDFIYPFLAQWPTDSQSAETLLVRREGDEALFLNDLRFKSGSAMVMRIPIEGSNIPAAMAAGGARGILEGVDYRGRPCIAAATEVPDSPWVLLARMNASEVMTQLESDRWAVMGFNGTLILLVGAGVYWIWRRRRALFVLALSRGRQERLVQEQRYQELFENLGVGVALIDKEMRVKQANRRMNEWFPESTKDEDSRCYRRFGPKESTAPCGDCPVTLTFDDGNRHHGNISRRINDQTRYFQIVTSPMFDSQGKVESVIEILDDVTERKRLETELAERQSILAAIADSAQDAIIMMDHEGLVSFWNSAAERMFGHPRSSILGKNLHMILAPTRFHADHHAAFRTFLQTGQGAAVGKTLELPALTADGRELAISLSLSGVRVGENWHAVGILRDVSEQKAAQQRLQAAMDQLGHANLQLEESAVESRRMAVEAQAASIAKSQFLANMSHEIRTPMNGVLGMIGLLLDTPLRADQRRYAEVVHSSGQALLDVINDILDFSKLEADKLELESIDFDLRNSVEDAAELLAFRAHEKGLEFICRVDPEVPSRLKGDPGRLRQVLVNLGGNAVKFTDTGEVVLDVHLVKETSGEATVRFSVRDTGIGIPLDKQGALFQAFQQVDASTTRKYGGTGLGLAICKRIVERMGGSITLESEPGKGSVFAFTLTLEKQASSAKLAPAKWGEIQGTRILAVDDNKTNREVLAEQLASWKADHTEVACASEALDALREAKAQGRPFKILLTDMQMPDMDGEGLGRMIKAEPAIASTLMVVMTSMGRRGDAKRLKEAGFSAYLTKPIKQSHLFECIARLLGEGQTPPGADAPIVTKHSLSDARRSETRILLAEDHPTNQLVALRILEKLGYSAKAVSDGQEALQELRATPYDLVLMDVQMPVMDGFEATHAIRSGQGGVLNPKIPIIAMTAHAIKGDKERCLAEGMDDYVSKPIDPQALVQALERQLSRMEEASLPLASGVPVSEPLGIANFDRASLWARLMQDPDLVKEVVAGFLEDMPKQLAAIREQIEQGNLQAAGSIGHTVKGAAANVGGMAFSHIAHEVEKAGKRGDREALNTLLGELESHFTLLQGQMQEELK